MSEKSNARKRRKMYVEFLYSIEELASELFDEFSVWRATSQAEKSIEVARAIHANLGVLIDEFEYRWKGKNHE